MKKILALLGMFVLAFLPLFTQEQNDGTDLSPEEEEALYNVLALYQQNDKHSVFERLEEIIERYDLIDKYGGTIFWEYNSQYLKATKTLYASIDVYRHKGLSDNWVSKLWQK